VDILRRYEGLTAESGETYLWYFPDGTAASVETSTSPEAQPTDGWGSSAMLWALVEGLAGVVDQLSLYRRVRLSPRWLAAGVTEADVRVGYARSGADIEYSFRATDDRIVLGLRAARSDVDLHVLLREGTAATRVTVDGAGSRFEQSFVESSPYVDLQVSIAGRAEVEIEVAS